MTNDSNHKQTQWASCETLAIKTPKFLWRLQDAGRKVLDLFDEISLRTPKLLVKKFCGIPICQIGKANIGTLKKNGRLKDTGRIMQLKRGNKFFNLPFDVWVLLKLWKEKHHFQRPQTHRQYCMPSELYTGPSLREIISEAHLYLVSIDLAGISSRSHRNSQLGMLT